jgi:hypothetical protein
MHAASTALAGLLVLAQACSWCVIGAGRWPPTARPGQRPLGTAPPTARQVCRVALDGGYAVALARAVPRCSPPAPAVDPTVVPRRSPAVIPRHILPVSGVDGRWHVLSVPDHKPGPYRPRRYATPVPLRLTGCGELGKSVVLGLTTIAVTVNAHTGRRPLDRTPAELISGRFLATGGRHSLATCPSARCLQIRLQVVSAMPSTKPGER